MNEHAKKIWKAWADGKLVQTQQSENGEWRTVEPIGVMPEMMPHKCPDNWRIKPMTERRMFRVFFDNDSGGPMVFEGSLDGVFDDVGKFTKSPSFNRWLTDWVYYEVEVEE